MRSGRLVSRWLARVHAHQKPWFQNMKPSISLLDMHIGVYPYGASPRSISHSSLTSARRIWSASTKMTRLTSSGKSTSRKRIL